MRRKWEYRGMLDGLKHVSVNEWLEALRRARCQTRISQVKLMTAVDFSRPIYPTRRRSSSPLRWRR